MLNHRYALTLNGKTYTKDFQEGKESFEGKWQPVLEAAHGKHHAVCRCPGRGERKLMIKHRERSDYYLARYAHSGPEHANDCRFYAAAPERSGLQGYAMGVVEETDDGGMRVKLARGIQQKTPGAAEVVEAPMNVAPGVKRPAMTLLGLLHLLWSESRLSTWYPAMEGKRHGELVSQVLEKCAGRVSVGRIKLDQVLLLAAKKNSAREASNRGVAAEAAKHKRRLIVISPLARYEPERHAVPQEKLPLSGPFGMPALYLQSEVWETTCQRFARELGAWRRGSRVIAIAQIEQRTAKAHQADVLEVGLMQVSAQWIPLDSGLEGTLEQKLRDEKRKFDKPLRYDADECEVFPDFWLLDMKEEFPLEVFGMATPQYLERRAKKEMWYRERYGDAGWWSWDAAVAPLAEEIPPLPAPNR